MSNVNQTSNAATQYREVSRKANAGERIKIVDACYAGVPPVYANGDVLTVVRDFGSMGVRVDRKWDVREGIDAWVAHREYVVLEPIAAPAPHTATLPDLFAQFIRDNAGAVRSYLAEIDPDMCAEPTEDVPHLAPLTRAKVIEMARERVAELQRIGRTRGLSLPAGTPFDTIFYNVEFVVNRDKRTVAALVRKRSNGNSKPDAVGIAKAAPDDVFNADIGKAIAAERALGLTLTDAFVNAPKPADKVAGMTVNYGGRVRKLVPPNVDIAFGETANVDSVTGACGKIIDDTDADYALEEGAKDGEAA